jgi:surface polysaccharide O-acyltransferase-like enzyme
MMGALRRFLQRSAGRSTATVSAVDLERVRQNLVMPSKVLRTLACALVVLVHVNIYVRSGLDNWWPGGFYLAPIFSIPVPAFFLLSGLHAGRPSAGTGRSRPRLFLRRNFRSLFVPFLFWNGVLLLLNPGHDRMSVASIGLYLLTGCWQLYYICALLQLRALHFWLDRFLDDRNLRRVLVASALLAILFHATADLMLWTRGAASGFIETYLTRLFVPWAVFFVFGIWLRRNATVVERLAERRFYLLPLIAMAYVGYCVELTRADAWLGFNPLQQFLFFSLPFKFLACLFVLGSLYHHRESRWLKWLTKVSQDTYGIYLAHTTVLVVGFELWRDLGHVSTHWIEVPVLWGAVWLSSRAAVRLARGLRPGWIGLVCFGMTSHSRRPATTPSILE